MAKRANNDKLRLWQDRLSRNESAYESEASRMDEREALYAGVNQLRAIVRGERKTQTPHVRNICAELIEAQTDSNIPQPKVTARRKKDEMKAKLIEDMLRNELDRMPFEQLNDMMERTVPIQGGAAFLVEWDNTQRTHFTIGELAVSTLHPKQIVPQDGVYTGVEDMDYIILKIPQTKEYIRRKYGVSVADESEREPDVKGTGDTSTADDLVTQYGGILVFHHLRRFLHLLFQAGDGFGDFRLRNAQHHGHLAHRRTGVFRKNIQNGKLQASHGKDLLFFQKAAGRRRPRTLP